jgi:hypothetical protein
MFGVSTAMVFAVIQRLIWPGLRTLDTEPFVEALANCARYGYRSLEVAAPLGTTAPPAL